MSERYGTCRFCHGRGERAIEVPGTQSSKPTELTALEQKELIRIGIKDFHAVALIQTKVVARKCGVCGGTGFSGDAMEGAVG